MPLPGDLQNFVERLRERRNLGIRTLHSSEATLHENTPSDLALDNTSDRGRSGSLINVGDCFGIGAILTVVCKTILS